MKPRIILTSLVVLTLACDSDEPRPSAGNAKFLDYTVAEQTALVTEINTVEKKIALEVAHNVDLSSLVPDYKVDGDSKVFVNGVEQTAGVSMVDLTKPVTYNLVNTAANTSTEWQVSAVQLNCKIVIDASHDGGVWWFPQYDQTGYDPTQNHQGKVFADLLRNKGFEVTELGRDQELTEEMFFGSYIVLRAGGIGTYTNKEVQVYSNLLKRGMNLAFFTDHLKYYPNDDIANLLGLKFQGAANGVIKGFAAHQITSNLESLDYIAGSAILDADLNSNIEVLGRLGPDDFVDLNANDKRDANEPTGSCVMGILNYPGSRVFFFGDMNSIQLQPQPFIDNLIGWMGDCSAL